MKNKLQPTRTTFSTNFQYKKAPRWLSKFFHFGTENWEEQLKKAPCIWSPLRYHLGQLGTTWHHLAKLGEHLVSFENCMNNTWAPIGTMETTSEQLGDNFGTTWRKLCDNF